MKMTQYADPDHPRKRAFTRRLRLTFRVDQRSWAGQLVVRWLPTQRSARGEHHELDPVSDDQRP